MRLILIINVFVLFCSLAPAQSPYRIHPQKEAVLLTSGGGLMAVGGWQWHRNEPFDAMGLAEFQAADVWRFDRSATRFYSKSANQGSDALLYGSAGLGLSLLAYRNIRNEVFTVSILYVESFLLTTGLMLTAKHSIRRARPFVYNMDVPISEKLTKDAKTSFFSGHTSFVAMNTFFSAKLYSDYYPKSRWKPIVWASAAVLPATTGVLRVRAGKHFPTDVITGYVVGATFGVLVPHFHRSTKTDLGHWYVYPIQNGGGLVISF